MSRNLSNEEYFRIFELMRRERLEQLLSADISNKKYVLTISSAFLGFISYFHYGKDLLCSNLCITLSIFMFLFTIIFSLCGFHYVKKYAYERMQEEERYYLHEDRKKTEFKESKYEIIISMLENLTNIAFGLGVFFVLIFTLLRIWQ